jgi:hypothetical protein
MFIVYFNLLGLDYSNKGRDYFIAFQGESASASSGSEFGHILSQGRIVSTNMAELAMAHAHARVERAVQGRQCSNHSWTRGGCFSVGGRH